MPVSGSARRKHATALVVLSVLSVVLWTVAVGVTITITVLLVRVGAPADRSLFLVVVWFIVLSVPAIGTTAGVVSIRRSRRGQQWTRE